MLSIGKHIFIEEFKADLFFGV
ncbi:hypothetical protein XFF7767_320037 [Xanthomonas citri pv. fuscans]|nr:hypothetical protein XFF7767_320037 [Xanthomonas citri pv. fuscans]SOO15692.1 hypothetical protein XFF7766_610006 [Xanthomonas citri pv. fuscans]